MPLKRAGLALWLPVAIVVVWQVLTSVGLLDALFFPAPSTLVSAAAKMLRHGDLIEQTNHTLGHTFIGFLAGSSAGLLCGLLMGGISAIEHSLEPLVSAVYATPNLTLLPLLMMFFGVGETPGIILIAIGCFILVAVHALDAVHRVNHCYVDLAANYGAARRAIFRKVYVPACLPGIFTGLRLALGRALVIAVSVELVSGSKGLGGMIWLAWQTLSTERLYIGVLTTAILGLVFSLTLRRLEGRLIPWGSTGQ
jgi:ABC-type nitrate/sulfonate/bicarbonate transport system permease component